MILSNLQNCKRVETLHSLLPLLFEYVKTHNLLNAPLGRISIKGDDLFINNCNPQCVQADKQMMEIHRKYMDVHILLQGAERIGWKTTGDLTAPAKPYDEAADIAFYQDKPTAFVDMLPGQMLIAWPEDAHAPLIGEGKIRKLIAKVKL